MVEESEEIEKKDPERGDEKRKLADKKKGKKNDDGEIPNKEEVEEDAEDVEAEEKSAMQLTKITKIEANIKTMKTDELQTLYLV